MRSELRRIETYYDTVPRASARTESVGPFTLFVATGGFPFYARPTLGAVGLFVIDDIDLVRARQRQLGVPEAIEWVHELTPGLADIACAAGLEVRRHPLMVLGTAIETPPPSGYRVWVLSPDDPTLPSVLSAIGIGFAASGTTVGPDGPKQRDEALQLNDPLHDFTREMMINGLLVMAAAEDAWGPVAGGSHSPRDGVSEITGVATLPTLRRRGIASAVTSALIADVGQSEVELCFLSAVSDEVARVYAGVGFTPIGTACIAAPPT